VHSKVNGCLGQVCRHLAGDLVLVRNVPFVVAINAIQVAPGGEGHAQTGSLPAEGINQDHSANPSGFYYFSLGWAKWHGLN
jgi:hypothetical protein